MRGKSLINLLLIVILVCFMAPLAFASAKKYEVAIALFGKHQGERFRHEVVAKDCFLSTSQWEKQADGSEVLWHYTELDLKGASLIHPMESIAASQPADAEAKITIPYSKVFDSRDFRKPFVSISVKARKGWRGQQEYWYKRKAAQLRIKRNHANWSPRNGGNTHVYFKSSSAMIMLRGKDTFNQVESLALAIDAYIRDICTLTN